MMGLLISGEINGSDDCEDVLQLLVNQSQNGRLSLRCSIEGDIANPTVTVQVRDIHMLLFDCLREKQRMCNKQKESK